MSTLHIINYYASGDHRIETLLSCAGENDTVLLIEDGVYLLLDNTCSYENRDIYALEEDVNARGLHTSHAPQTVNWANYQTFVRLACDHDKTVTWSN